MSDGVQHPAGPDPRWAVAISAMVSGMTTERAADAAGVSRTTLHRWGKDPAFRAMLEETKAVLVEAAQTRLKGLLERAVRVIEQALDSADEKVALSAAKTVLAQLAKTEPHIIEVHSAPANLPDPGEADERLRLVSGGKWRLE
jgi:AcrR family transcriptional regulator